ncbi:MAG TPA: crossover junction endodeoxyribonuclease RuvC [Candidatus Omnitrophota bacterium]|nr:crossover junction endodeoxyribonuclease RuvC [Candidatus Omnitrophota bacterium]HPT38933.1 crossover junction endodeoxyribonuclease RuvC [Candidatus Omnitrophota bacterium]
MIIVGVDPALAVSGYGVIQVNKTSLSLIEAGIIKTNAKESVCCRLDKIYRGVIKLVSDTKADCLVLEKIYSHYKHPATACILGQARGVICLAAYTAKVPFFEYSATRIKKAIVGKGLASKAQVQRMVTHTLGLKTLTPYMDVTDALALAIGHSYISKAKL